jgi:hypothetical protein
LLQSKRERERERERESYFTLEQANTAMTLEQVHRAGTSSE